MPKGRLARAVPGYLIALITLVLIVTILISAKAVIVPLALAVLLTFILTPIVSAVQGLGMRRLPAVLVVAVLTFMVIGALGWGVGAQVRNLAEDLPTQTTRIKDKIGGLQGPGWLSGLQQMAHDIFDAPKPQTESAKPGDIPKEKVYVAPPDDSSSLGQVLRVVGPILEPLATAGLVVILVIFMLVKREDLRNRFIGLLGHGRMTGTTRVLVDAAQRLSRYLLTQLAVNAAFGVIFGSGLFLMQVPYAFLWGFLTGVLRFVPYVGTWIAAAFPVLLSFATSDGWAQPVGVLAFFAFLDLVTANVIEPLLFGHSTGVSPVALLVAAAFWTWVWGPVGLVLSTPLTVCLVVLGQHVPRLKFLALLLGDEPPLEPHMIYYQRLLARDPIEAKAVATNYAKQHGLEKTCDDVLLPALLLARRDREHAGLNPEDEAYIYATTREVLAAMASAPAPTPEIPANTSEPKEPQESTENKPAVVVQPELAPTVALVVGYPAHHVAEELALWMLACLLKPNCALEVLTTHELPGLVEERIESEHPEVIVIAVIPPGGSVQAGYMCEQLRKRFPELKIVVGYFGAVKDFDKLLVRLRTAGATYVTTSIAQSRTQVLGLAQPAGVNKPALQPAEAS
jgi:predicted PurR-regulated permease PerM